MKQFHCDKCEEVYEVDLDEAKFSSQITVFNGEKSESRMYFGPCPNCKHVNTFESENPQQWGSQKSPSLFKIKSFIGGSCLLSLIAGVAVAYFATQGIKQIIEWLS